MSNRQVTCRVPSRCVFKTDGRKPRINRVVVFEKTACRVPYRNQIAQGSPYSTPLKVCTGRIRGVCPPEICDCPNMKCVNTKQRTRNALIKAAKAALALGFVYETWQLGVWSDPEETAQLSHDYMTWAKDFFWTKNKIQRTGEEIYDMGRIKYNFKNVWNNINFWLNGLAQGMPAAMRGLGDTVLPRRSTAVVEKKPPPPQPKPQKLQC